MLCEVSGESGLVQPGSWWQPREEMVAALVQRGDDIKKGR